VRSANNILKVGTNPSREMNPAKPKTHILICAAFLFRVFITPDIVSAKPGSGEYVDF
jgi:hypothetical protein